MAALAMFVSMDTITIFIGMVMSDTLAFPILFAFIALIALDQRPVN